jgi:hypothetical protein
MQVTSYRTTKSSIHRMPRPIATSNLRTAVHRPPKVNALQHASWPDKYTTVFPAKPKAGKANDDLQKGHVVSSVTNNPEPIIHMSPVPTTTAQVVNMLVVQGDPVVAPKNPGVMQGFSYGFVPGVKRNLLTKTVKVCDSRGGEVQGAEDIPPAEAEG